MAVDGQGGGEAVGVGESVAGVEFGGLPGEVVGGGDPVAGGLRWWAGGKSRSLTPAA